MDLKTDKSTAFFKRCSAFWRLHGDKLIYALAIFLFGLVPAGSAFPFGLALFFAFDGSVSAGLFAILISSVMTGSAVICFPAALALAAFRKLLFKNGEVRPILKICLALTVSALMCLIKLQSGFYGAVQYAVSVAALPVFVGLYGLITPASAKNKGASFQAGLGALLFTAALLLTAIPPSGIWARFFVLIVTLWAAKEGGMAAGGVFGFFCGLACDTGSAAAFGVCGLSAGLLASSGSALMTTVGCVFGFCTGLYFFGMDNIFLTALYFSGGGGIYFTFSEWIHRILSLKAVFASASIAVPTQSGELAEALYSIAQSAKTLSDGVKGEQAAESFVSLSGIMRSAEEREAAQFLKDSAASDSVARLLSNAGVRASSVTVVGTRRKRLLADGVALDDFSLSSKELSMLISTALKVPMCAPEFSVENGVARLMMESAPRFRVECARTGISKRGEELCGDTVSLFGGEDGFFHALISDGMGSGKEAAASSKLTVTFLEKLMTVGAERGAALSLLNNFLSERDGECFATVDMFSADLYTGEAVIVKAGAAPSFILRGRSCKRVQSATVPAGIIGEMQPEQLTFSLKDGDTVVMISDGLAGEDGGADKVFELLRHVTAAQTTADIANALLSRAIRLYGRHDDMSVCVIRVHATTYA